jgi:hypothetical protein
MELCGSLMFTAHLCIGKYGLVIHYYNMLFFFTDTPNRKVGKTDLMQNIEKTKGNEKKQNKSNSSREIPYASGLFILIKRRFVMTFFVSK